MRSLLLVVCLCSTAHAVNPIPEATSYAKPVAGGAFVLVQHGNPVAETKFGSESEQARFRALREQYPTPGLYNAADRSLVWSLPADRFTPYDQAFVSPDGVYCVRIDGEFWKTAAYTGGRLRPTDESEQAQIDGSAISFWRSGSLMKQYSVRELVTDPAALPATPQHILWYASGMMTPASGSFNLNTQESIRHRFNYATGELVSTTPVGLANPLTQQILMVIGGLTALILVGWVVFISRGRPAVTSPSPVA